ncbi:YlbL family protein [Mobilicoccus pelagius]|uniref:PDZ domain-containing protein n=1 Tax=Mobilicoccus pelagius NBRC 104925 TaxID=1089455 RepID=H5URR8_9MICO|nr:PDZ domain-containing protein [Mobilicoccus pelagius]GAB48426.1 hypothetical protein MOPEL_073_00660 [Mobilicoccus pelagius NBRC 104925]
MRRRPRATSAEDAGAAHPDGRSDGPPDDSAAHVGRDAHDHDHDHDADEHDHVREGTHGETIGAGSTRAPRRRRPLVGRSLSGFLFLLVLLGLVAQFVTLPFVILRPGPAVDVLGTPEDGAPVVTVAGAKTYPTSGSLFFTTVAQYGGPGRRPNAWDVGVAFVDPRAELMRESVVYPPQVSEKQVRDENTAAMTDSQQEAVAVALRRVGRPVTERAVVARVLPDGPAEGVVEKGDVVTAVDGRPVAHAADITAHIQKTTGPVRLTVLRGGKERTLTLTPVVREKRRLVGILVQPTFSFGVDVAIHAGDVGGPSAGMMFGLGIYDTLTPGALTGGRRIAGTGTLDSTGRVGPIGGIEQKLQGAKDAGAGWFLAPRTNCGEVVGHVPAGLVVTPVTTFDEALDAVESIAAGKGNTLPACPAG